MRTHSARSARSSSGGLLLTTPTASTLIAAAQTPRRFTPFAPPLAANTSLSQPEFDKEKKKEAHYFLWRSVYFLNNEPPPSTPPPVRLSPTCHCHHQFYTPSPPVKFHSAETVEWSLGWFSKKKRGKGKKNIYNNIIIIKNGRARAVKLNLEIRTKKED